jgi:hypothetical protein
MKREVDYSCLSHVEYRNAGAQPPLPHTSLRIVVEE